MYPCIVRVSYNVFYEQIRFHNISDRLRSLFLSREFNWFCVRVVSSFFINFVFRLFDSVFVC